MFAKREKSFAIQYKIAFYCKEFLEAFHKQKKICAVFKLQAVLGKRLSFHFFADLEKFF